MREDFYETSVAPSNEHKQKRLLTFYNVLFVLAILFFVVTIYFWLLTFDTGFIFLFVPALIFGVLLWFLKRRICAYFDYTYISGEVRIVKVINGKSRRKFLVFDSKSVIQVGKVGSGSFDKLFDSGNCKVKIATPNGLNAEKQLYYVYLKVDNEDTLLILECDERFLSFIVSNRGKNIIEKDYN